MIINQFSRISHHTITDGLSFSVPSQEDFTLPITASGSWTPYDLALSEIGVDELQKKAYIRINDEIKEFVFTGTGSNCCPLSSTLALGNTTGANNIILSDLGINSSRIIDEPGENWFGFSDKSGTTFFDIQAGSSSNERSYIEGKKDELQLRSLVDTGVAEYSEISLKPQSLQIQTNTQGDPVIIQQEYYQRHLITTTNSTPVDIFTYSFNAGSIKYFEADLTAVNLTRTEASYDGFFSVIRRDLGGTLHQVSSVDKTTKTEFTTASASFGFSGSTVYCKVSGETGTTINWILNIKYR